MIYNKTNIMNFDQEYTIYFLQESVTAFVLKGQSFRSLQEINLHIPSQNSKYLPLTILRLGFKESLEMNIFYTAL